MNFIIKLLVFSFLLGSNCSCANKKINKNEEIIQRVRQIEIGCFYKESTIPSDEKYPFNIADKIELVSHISPWEEPEIKGDSIFVDSFMIRNIQERVILNQIQTDSLNTILYNYTSNLEFHGYACYAPRHSIIFYKDNLPIAYIDICLSCYRMKMSEKIAIAYFCLEKKCMLQNYFKSLGLKYGFAEGICN